MEDVERSRTEPVRILLLSNVKVYSYFLAKHYFTVGVYSEMCDKVTLLLCRPHKE